MVTHIFSLLCLAMATGCHSYNPVTLRVADHQGTPVAGATAVAAPMYFFNPTNESYLFIGAYDILEPFPAEGDQGITNDEGTVTLQVVAESPLQLKIYADGFSTWAGQFSLTKQNEPELKRIDSGSQLVVTLD